MRSLRLVNNTGCQPGASAPPALDANQWNIESAVLKMKPSAFGPIILNLNQRRGS
jgi:hypothetical protein